MFEGKSNNTKIKVLLVLHHERYDLGNRKGLTARDIAVKAGVSLPYIRNRLPKWWRWRYTGRAVIVTDGKAEIRHRICARGRLYLEDVCSSRCPEKLLNCVDEIKNIKIPRLVQEKGLDKC